MYILWEQKEAPACNRKNTGCGIHCLTFTCHGLEESLQLIKGLSLYNLPYSVVRNTVRGCFMHFTLLCLSDIVFFFKLRVCGNPRWATLSVLFFQQHMLTSCLCITFWQLSQCFKLFHYYYTILKWILYKND